MEKPDKNPDMPKHRGSEALIDKYNINDQAHSDSSTDDFVKTVSEYHHADEGTKDESTENNQTT